MKLDHLKYERQTADRNIQWGMIVKTKITSLIKFWLFCRNVQEELFSPHPWHWWQQWRYQNVKVLCQIFLCDGQERVRLPCTLYVDRACNKLKSFTLS